MPRARVPGDDHRGRRQPGSAPAPTPSPRPTSTPDGDRPRRRPDGIADRRPPSHRHRHRQRQDRGGDAARASSRPRHRCGPTADDDGGESRRIITYSYIVDQHRQRHPDRSTASIDNRIHRRPTRSAARSPPWPRARSRPAPPPTPSPRPTSTPARSPTSPPATGTPPPAGRDRHRHHHGHWPTSARAIDVTKTANVRRWRQAGDTHHLQLQGDRTPATSTLIVHQRDRQPHPGANSVTCPAADPGAGGVSRPAPPPTPSPRPTSMPARSPTSPRRAALRHLDRS